MITSLPQQKLQEFSHLELFARQAVEGFITGLHKSPFHGFSVEFAEHRSYNTGESTRYIDWKLFARTEKFFVKRFEEETNLRCQLVIDHSSSMLYPYQQKNDPQKHSKLSFSVHCAAALIYLLRKQRDASGLSLFSDTIELHTPSKLNSVHNKRMFYELEKLLDPLQQQLSKKTFVANALHQLAENIHKRSLVVIFSDLFENASQKDEIFPALQHFKHNKHEVILFHVTDKRREQEFDFENRPYNFIDLETNEQIKVNPSEIRENYIKALENFQKELKLKCGQYQIDLVEADINKPIEEVLLPFLIKRSKLF